jgi:hypothetical protein
VRCTRLAYLTILYLITVTITMRRNSSAGIVTKIRAARPRNRGSFRDIGKRLCFWIVQPALGPTDPRTQWIPSSFFSGKSGQDMKLSSYLSLLPRLEMKSYRHTVCFMFFAGTKTGTSRKHKWRSLISHNFRVLILDSQTKYTQSTLFRMSLYIIIVFCIFRPVWGWNM